METHELEPPAPHVANEIARSWREICENKNTALAIMIGAASIGVCIIAAAVH